MKKIIAGKKYDTETAEKLGSYSQNAGSFQYIKEVLYRKRTGEFFLYGEGGPASDYREQVELNTWSGGEAITPLSYEEAQRWTEEHLDGDDYERIFGVVEDLEKVTIPLSVPAAAADLLRKEAGKTGKPMSDIAAALLLEALK